MPNAVPKDADSAGDRARSLIASRWPDVAAQLRVAPPYTGLQLDSSGPVPTLTADGIRLASAWDPDAEAALQVAHLPAACDAITLYGVGMGALPAQLLPRLTLRGRLEVVLMNVSLFATLLDLIDQTDWLAHPAVELTLAAQHARVADSLAITTPLLRLAEPEAERLRDQLLQVLSAEHVRAQLAGREALTRANMQVNERQVAADPDVALLFARTCETAVVVAAGPSLDLALERIASLQRQGARIICVDAGLCTLADAGIRPDYIVTLDPQPAAARFFDLDLTSLRSAALVYFPHTSPLVLRCWPWDRYVAYTAQARYDGWRQRLPRSSLFTSGSVVHPAVDLAIRIGARNVYLAGADFGYPLATSHATAATFCEPVAETLTAGPSVTSYSGRRVPSAMNFVSYYRDLEAFIGSPLCAGCRFVNLGQYSARLAGVSHENLD